jgi:hypothetical protein
MSFNYEFSTQREPPGTQFNPDVMTQARQEIRIWRGLTQRHMGVRGRTVT